MVSSSTFNAASGDGYNLQMGRWSRRLAGPFLDFADIGDAASILDVGSGTGSLSFAMRARYPGSRIRGIDFSPIYVDHAARQPEARGIEFAVGDACDMRFADGSFDAVLSMLVLHFVPQPERAVAEMHRVARPGAVVAATVWDIYGGMPAQRLFFDIAVMLDPAAEPRRGRALNRPMTKPGELAQAWRQAGFADVEESTLAIRMEFASFDDYWAPYMGQDGPGPEYMRTLAPAQVAPLKEALRRAFLAGDPDGPRSFTSVAWAVKGRTPG